MCLVREYKRYIANVHINEKIIHHCDVMSFHHRKDIKNVTIKLKILQDIHSEKINTGLLLLFNTLFGIKIKYNYYDNNGNILCYMTVIKKISNHSLDSIIYYMINSLCYHHRNNSNYVQDNTIPQ